MPRQERHALQLDDDENRRLHAVWSRSGKRLIVTATTQQWGEERQVELRPEQVTTLIQFLSETVGQEASDR
jgi:hypothetical protein